MSRSGTVSEEIGPSWLDKGVYLTFRASLVVVARLGVTSRSLGPIKFRASAPWHFRTALGKLTFFHSTSARNASNYTRTIRLLPQASQKTVNACAYKSQRPAQILPDDWSGGIYIQLQSPPRFPAMDVKEIELRGKAISKAMAGDEPSASFMKLLGDLKSVRATEDLLRQTKIGVTINRLRTYKYPEVAKLAQELIMKWKDEVNKGKKKGAAAAKAGGAATPSNGAAVGSSAPPSGAASPAPQAAGKKKHNVDPALRNDRTDKVNTTVFNIPARDNCIKLMYNGLAFMSEERKFSYSLNLSHFLFIRMERERKKN